MTVTMPLHVSALRAVHCLQGHGSGGLEQLLQGIPSGDLQQLMLPPNFTNNMEGSPLRGNMPWPAADMRMPGSMEIPDAAAAVALLHGLSPEVRCSFQSNG